MTPSKLAELQEQKQRPKRRVSRQVPRSPETNDDTDQIASNPTSDKTPVNATHDSDIDPVEMTVISPEPTLTDATVPPTSNGGSTGFRFDPKVIPLGGVEVDRPLYTYLLSQEERSESTIRIPTSHSLIRVIIYLTTPPCRVKFPP